VTSPSHPEKTVGEVMHSGVVTCNPDATLRVVARILAAHRIHAVVVATGDEKAPCAVVTDRDVVLGHARNELDRVTARDAANEPAITVRASADLRHAADLMAHYGTSHLVVTEGGGRKPVGVLSSLDVAAAVAGSST
jgi:CBS domain-containing protein